MFANQDPEALPTVVRHADTLAEHNSDAEFDFGSKRSSTGRADWRLPTTRR
jgi:hypothetical protein